MTPAIRTDDLARVIRRAAHADRDLQTLRPVPIGQTGDGLADAILCTSADFPGTKHLFDRLRWGGHFIYVCQARQEADRIGAQLGDAGFEITQKPRPIASVGSAPCSPFSGETIIIWRHGRWNLSNRDRPPTDSPTTSTWRIGNAPRITPWSKRCRPWTW